MKTAWVSPRPFFFVSLDLVRGTTLAPWDIWPASDMTHIAEGLGLAALFVVGYAYLGYPVLLLLLSRLRRNRVKPATPSEWPRVSVVIPVYNEEAVIRQKIERVLEYDYPADRRQILVVSDASTDRTDEIAREFAARGVELVRLPERRGKTGAENAALPHI